MTIHVDQELRDDCCNDSSRRDMTYHVFFLGQNPQNKWIDKNTRPELKIGFEIRSFFSYTNGMYASALGIEILCIAAAEIGENTGFYLFGFNASGIVIAYVMGYALTGFTTFVTILGRYGNQYHDKKGNGNHGIDSCCHVLEQDSTQ